MQKIVFEQIGTGFSANRPDPWYFPADTMAVTIYSLDKLCQKWSEHSSLDGIKEHFSTLNDKMDFTDFLLGPRKQRQKRFLYPIYNEIWKLGQIETAKRIRQIDQENLEKAIKVVDNGMNTLSKRIYSVNHILSSVLDLLRGDLSLLQKGQTQLRAVFQLNLALQTIRAGRVPWQFLNITDIFTPYNLTLMQQTMAKKDAAYSLLTIEHLNQVPFSFGETLPSPDFYVV